MGKKWWGGGVLKIKLWVLKRNTTKNYSQPTHAKNVYKGKEIIKTIEDKIISDTRNFFKHEEEEKHFKPEKIDKCYGKNFIIMKAGTTRIKHYKLKNTSIKLDHI